MPLTKPQLVILDFIRGFMTDERRSPTLQEIADGTGKAIATVCVHTQSLILKGHLERVRRIRGPVLVLIESPDPEPQAVVESEAEAMARVDWLAENLASLDDQCLDRIFPGLADLVRLGDPERSKGALACG